MIRNDKNLRNNGFLKFNLRLRPIMTHHDPSDTHEMGSKACLPRASDRASGDGRWAKAEGVQHSLKPLKPLKRDATECNSTASCNHCARENAELLQCGVTGVTRRAEAGSFRDLSLGFLKSVCSSEVQ